MSNRTCIFTILALLSFPVSIRAQAAANERTAGKPLRILFVGNSYTYENNLPFVFEALASPLRKVKVTMMASGGAPLRRHIEGGRLLKIIRERQFDVVVAQEQSVLGRLQLFDGMALIQDDKPYRQAVREIAAAARSGGARLVLFSTWPRAETPRSLAALHNASVGVAKEVGATVAPVGLVWDRLGGDSCQVLHLYAGDGSHPAYDGTYVAAVVLIRAIVGKMPALKPVSKVPLMDGAAQLSGSFADITPTEEGISALNRTVNAVYAGARRGRFAALPAASAIPEPDLPPDPVRGRINSSFLRGEWQGEFLTFGTDYHATLTLDIRGAQASVRMVHPEGPTEDDDAATDVRGPGTDGVLTLSYQSKPKNCRVELRLVRVGNRLRGVVKFVVADEKVLARSTICLVRTLNPTWSVDQEKQHLKYRQDPNTWAWDLLKRDLDYISEGGTTNPIRFGAFPVPKYELLGKESFKGIGAGGNLSGIAYEGKTIVYGNFYANRNAINKPFIGDKPNEVFFTIVVLTDFVDTVHFTHGSLHMISRNNPDYIARGFFKTKKDEIDFTAFITASRDEFAIVNMRLFNLKYGRTILIAPQKDGALRSMQLTSPILSAMEIKNYIDKILKQKDVNKFFTNKENI